MRGQRIRGLVQNRGITRTDVRRVEVKVDAPENDAFLLLHRRRWWWRGRRRGRRRRRWRRRRLDYRIAQIVSGDSPSQRADRGATAGLGCGIVLARLME